MLTMEPDVETSQYRLGGWIKENLQISPLVVLKKKNLKELKFFVVVQILNEQKATLGPLFANPRW